MTDMPRWITVSIICAPLMLDTPGTACEAGAVGCCWPAGAAWPVTAPKGLVNHEDACPTMPCAKLRAAASGSEPSAAPACPAGAAGAAAWAAGAAGCAAGAAGAAIC